MLIGILETGRVPETLVPRFGDYPAMFEALLAPAGADLGYRSYFVEGGELPVSPGECDAWLITGSRHGVYDELPWIAPLKDFLRAARAAGRPIVGICFGHQILAEAFGGRAEKSAKGWGIGVQDYEVVRRPGWMAGAPARFATHAMHQDQVTAIPEDATVLARSPFCEYAMLAYGDPEAPDAISIQPHPEFSAGYARALVEIRAVALPQERSAAALASLGRPVDDGEFARWCVDFLRRAMMRRDAA